MSTSTPRRSGGRTLIDLDPGQLKWILLARESTLRERQLDHQLTDLRARVASIGGTVDREIPENAVSAFKRKRVQLPDGTFGFRVVRPEWEKILTALRRGECNALMVPDIDRATRDPRTLEDLIDAVELYGLYVASLTGNIDLTTDAGISAARGLVNQRNQESRNTVAAGYRRAAARRDERRESRREEPAVRLAQRPYSPEQARGGAYPAGDPAYPGRGPADHAGARMERTRDTHRQRQPVARGNDQEYLHRAAYRRICGIPGRDPLRPGREYGPGTMGTDPDRGGIRGGDGEMEAGIADSVTARGDRERAWERITCCPRSCGAGNATRGCSAGAGIQERARWSSTGARQKAKADAAACRGLPPRSNEYIKALVIAEQQKIEFRKLEDLPPWPKAQELADLQARIEESTRRYEEGSVFLGTVFAVAGAHGSATRRN